MTAHGGDVERLQNPVASVGGKPADDGSVAKVELTALQSSAPRKLTMRSLDECSPR